MLLLMQGSHTLASEPTLEGSFDWTPPDWYAAWKWSRHVGYLLAIDGRNRFEAWKRAGIEPETIVLNGPEIILKSPQF